jgi:hypothetical protein
VLTGDPAGRFGAGPSGQFLRECPPSSAIGQQISGGGLTCANATLPRRQQPCRAAGFWSPGSRSLGVDRERVERSPDKLVDATARACRRRPSPAPERVVVGEGVPQARAAPRDAGPAGSRPHHGPCGSGDRLGRPKNVPLPRVEPPPRPRHPTRGQQLPLAQKFREAPLPQVRAGAFSILCSGRRPVAARQKAPARLHVLPSVWHPPSALGGAPPAPTRRPRQSLHLPLVGSNRRSEGGSAGGSA